jgi:hypothetical protein
MALELKPMAAIESIGIDPKAVVDKLDPRPKPAPAAQHHKRNWVLVIVVVMLGGAAVAAVLAKRRNAPDQPADAEPVVNHERLTFDDDSLSPPTLQQQARGA